METYWHLDKQILSGSPLKADDRVEVFATWNSLDQVRAIIRAWKARQPIVLLNPMFEDKSHGAWAGLQLEFESGRCSIEKDHPFLSCLAPGFQAILQTSGTTGEARFVSLDAASIIYNTGIIRQHLLLNNETILCHMPLFHAFGLVLCFFQAYLHDHPFVVSERFDPNLVQRQLKEIGQRRVLLPLVPAMIKSFKGEPCQVDGVSIVGGDVVGEGDWAALQQTFPNLRHTVGYGLTEAGPVLTHTNLQDAGVESGCIGQALSGISLRWTTEGAMEFQSPGQCSQIWDAVTQHWRVSRGSWLPTGDLVRQDSNGTLHFWGRQKWIIKRKGETLSPLAIEGRLSQELPGESEFAVVGCQTQGVPQIVLVYAGRLPLSAIEKATRNMPRFLRPDLILSAKDLPRNGLGKLQRGKLQDHVEREILDGGLNLSPGKNDRYPSREGSMNHFRIQAVAKTTGIPAFTIRNWEKRYCFPLPISKEKGVRFYSEEQVQLLLHVKNRIDQGERAGDVIAEVAKAAAKGLPPRELTDAVNIGKSSDLERLYKALLRYDWSSVTRLAAALKQSLNPYQYLEWILIPLLSRVGRDWASNRATIAQEHFISSFARNELSTFLAATSPLSQLQTDASSRIFVLTSLSGETHEGGLMLLGTYLRLRGHTILYLGLNTPFDDLLTLLSSVENPVLCLTWSFRKRFEHQVHDLSTLKCPVFVGGRAFDDGDLLALPANLHMVRGDGLSMIAMMETILSSGSRPQKRPA